VAQAKQQNLRQWAEAAVPLLAAQGIETTVIGTVPDALRRLLARPGLCFAGPVDDLGPHLANARLGLVAEDVGGGFKLKTLDYIFHRLPVAALDGNLAGQPAGVIDNVLTAPNSPLLAVAIAAAIDDLECLNRMQQNAFTAAAAAFDWKYRACQLIAALSTLDRRE
jgi:polysaccharide biosynthesis protein PslH